MVPLYKVFMPDGIDEELMQILHSGKLSYGDHAKMFEKKLQELIENQLVLTTGTANNALQIAFDLLDLPVGSEVIVSPMSCLASTQPILTNKLKIKFVDIDPATGTLSPDEVVKNISSKTKAILHYHWCGYPGYIDEINKVAADNGLYLVEDATEAFGAKYKNNYIGNTGSDIVCFNFGPVRLPNTIDGGALSFNSEELYNKALLMRDYGIERSSFRDARGEITPSCDIKSRGYGALMNEVSGYIGNRQMELVNELLGCQYKNGSDYKNYFSELNDTKILDQRDEIVPSYWVYSMLVERRDEIINELKQLNVSSSAVHLRNDFYSCFGNFDKNRFPGTNYFSARNIAIPSGWWVTRDVITSITKHFLLQ